MPSARWVTSIVGLSSTAGFPTLFPDWQAPSPFGLTAAVVVNSSASTFNLEVSNDYSGSSTFNSTAATWFSSLASSLTGNALISIGFPVSAVRLNVTAGSSTGQVTATVIQAG